MTDLFAKVNCTYCQEEINGLRIQCCICVDFDICLQCFASGAEIGPHRNDHSYKFVDHCAVSIFGGRGSWTGREELQLLDAMELYGFGNWDFVSQQLETRTSEEVKDEYLARYLEGNIGKATWTAVANKRPILTDHTPEDQGPLAPSTIARLPPLDVTQEEARLIGYMQFRDDYDREYDMEAEQLITSLQLNFTQDSKTEITLKLSHIDIYIRRLRERARRKRIIRDYQLVSKFFNSHRKDVRRLLSKESKELYDKMRVFSQFLISGEHDRIISSIERERELRFRISELFKYRTLGLTTQNEAIHYEQHAAFQQQQIKQNKAGSSGCAASEIQEIQLINRKEEVDQNLPDEKFLFLQEVESKSTSSTNTSLDSVIVQPSINALPYGKLLSQQEIQLCSSLNLEPVQYTTLKTLIIQDHMGSTTKTNSSVDAPGTSEMSIREAVTYYLGTSGWLSGVIF